MARSSLQELQDAVINASQYPCNGLHSKTQNTDLLALRDQLRFRAKSLFRNDTLNVEESDVDFDIWELEREYEGFHETRVKDTSALETLLRRSIVQNRPDPRDRLFFLHAPHSRAQLNITQTQFLQILTYHRVMPNFLEYVFPFGKQHFPRDFHLMGFRSESKLIESMKGPSIPQLGRSGRHIELCYSLKSVEKSGDPPFRRSIRQCSVHHSFDLMSEQSTWIFIKANEVISDAVKEKVEENLANRVASADKEPSSLTSSLDTHAILASWAGADWRWYISELESYVQAASRPTLHASWELPQQIADVSTVEETAVTMISDDFLPPETTDFGDLSFRNLQNMHFVEEKANEVLLILKANTNVLQDMVHEYRTVMEVCSSSVELPKDFVGGVRDFSQKIQSIEKDMTLQIARAQSLLSFTADRKSLMNGLFQFRSMEASKLYAEKAQLSAENMEAMTEQMNNIAKQTEAETFFMRIIPWATLFLSLGIVMGIIISKHDLKSLSGVSWPNIGVVALEI